MFWMSSFSTGKRLWAGLSLLLLSVPLWSQGLSINTSGNSPDASAMLDVSSTSQGFLMPRMSSTQRINIASPAPGLMVFDTDRGTPYTYHSGQWLQMVPIPGGSIVWRTDRQDVLMGSAGFAYFTEQLIPNGISTLEWRVPAPTTTGAATARQSPITVWTGSEMLIWGGFDGSAFIIGGGRYAPDTDTWTSVSIANAPLEISAGWTASGDDLYVFGGAASGLQSNIGYIYNWAADSWGLMSFNGDIPSARSLPGMAWLGDKVCVWGGFEQAIFTSTYLNSGAIYDVGTQTWTAMATTGAPAGRSNPAVLYNGSEVIVWGGTDPNILKDGAIYSPATDTWTAIPTDPVLNNLAGGMQAFLVQGRLVVIGVDSGTGFAGGIYNFTTQTWTALNTTGAPSGRVEYSLISTGKTLTLWGGRSGGTYFGDGSTFDPIANSWTTFSLANAPTARARLGACWTGDEMIIFGGVSSGASYLQAPAILQSPGFDTYYLYRKN